MNLSVIKDLVTSKAGRQILTLQKHSPQILFGAGVVGVVATVVMASKATLQLDDVLADHRMDMRDLETIAENKGMPDEEQAKFKALLYGKTTTKIVKLYGPAFTVGVASIACLTSSHHILTQRNAGLMVAYSALEKGFNKYRERVVADVGSDKDREYRYGTETVTYEKTNKNGTVKTVSEVRVANDGEYSIYAKMFGRDTSQSWSPEAGNNILFLKSHQNWANDKLKARGHLFLNEVYDALGLERTKEGALVGWVWQGDGDNYVDFGVFDRQMQPEHFDFFTGREDTVWLDFNVDGVVWDKI